MRKALAVILAACPVLATAQDSDWKVSGSGEAAITFPSSGSETLGFRQFDTEVRKIRLINGRIIIQYRDPKTGLGFYAEPWFGDSADILWRTETSGTRWLRYIGQGYLSYAAKDFNFDLGKFTSWIGYESALSADGDFLSRGLLYTLAQPVYHVGARASFTSNPDTSWSLFATRGWNQADRDTGGISFGGQVKHNLSPKTTATLGYIGGEEGANTPNRAGSFGGIGFSNPGPSRVDLLDLIVAHEVSERTKLALNADVARTTGPNDGTWYCLALFGNHQLTPTGSVGARLEWVRDNDGVRTGNQTDLMSIAGVYSHTLSEHATLRFELRHDWSRDAVFVRRGASRSSQSTLEAGLILRF